jgi:uncharacterized protein (DUF2267 family)
MDKRAFVREVASRLHADEDRAEAVTGVVLTELRDRLTPKEAHDVGSQMTADLRRLWDGIDRPPQGIRKVKANDFAALQHLLGSPDGTQGEAWDVFSVLPGDLKRLWLDSAQPLE